MTFVVAGYGSRGDVEPCVAVGRELLRRGDDVRMAVPPNMLGFIESAGLAAVAYGPDSQAVEGFRRDLSKIQNPISKVREVTEHVTQVWAEKGTIDQPIWAAAVTRLKVGSGRRFSESSRESLVADLRLILAPRYASRARRVAAQMIKPAESRARAADLLEETARRGRLA